MDRRKRIGVGSRSAWCLLSAPPPFRLRRGSARGAAPSSSGTAPAAMPAGKRAAPGCLGLLALGQTFFFVSGVGPHLGRGRHLCCARTPSIVAVLAWLLGHQRMTVHTAGTVAIAPVGAVLNRGSAHRPFSHRLCARVLTCADPCPPSSWPRYRPGVGAPPGRRFRLNRRPPSRPNPAINPRVH